MHLITEAAAVDSTKPIMELYSTVDANNYETPVSTMNRQIGLVLSTAAASVIRCIVNNVSWEMMQCACIHLSKVD